MKKKKVCTIYFDESGETVFKWHEPLFGVEIPDCYGDVIKEFQERYNKSLSKDFFMKDYNEIVKENE